MVGLALAINLLWFIGERLLGLRLENGHSIIYSLQVLTIGVSVLLIVILQVSCISLAAEMLDELDLATGRRQEGVVIGASSFVKNATTGAGSLLAGIVIDLSGMTPELAPGEVSHEVFQSLG